MADADPFSLGDSDDEKDAKTKDTKINETPKSEHDNPGGAHGPETTTDAGKQETSPGGGTKAGGPENGIAKSGV